MPISTNIPNIAVFQSVGCGVTGNYLDASAIALKDFNYEQTCGGLYGNPFAYGATAALPYITTGLTVCNRSLLTRIMVRICFELRGY